MTRKTLARSVHDDDDDDDDINGHGFNVRGYRSGGRLVPIPDPTALTTKLVREAITSLKAELETRFNAMDKATDLLHADYTRVPTEMDRQIMHLRELVTSNVANVMGEIEKFASVSNERFARIDTQFASWNMMSDKLSLADKTAVAAALQAAKEAVGAQNTSNAVAIAKSEVSTVESIRQLQNLFNSGISSLNDKVNDLKSRIDRGEGHTGGQKDMTGWVVAGISLLLLIGTFVLRTTGHV